MEKFTIRIAGHVVAVTSKSRYSRKNCEDYLCDKEPEFAVELTQGDIDFERVVAEQERAMEGLSKKVFADYVLERTALQRKIAEKFFEYDILLFHGSVIAIDGEAYLFTAPCGTGKSTHTRSWMTLFGDRAVMVNDDKPFLHISSSGVLAYGSPWNGKHGLSTNVCVPLKGICLLHRGNENVICGADAASLRDLLIHQLHIPNDPVLARRVATLAEILLDQLPLWEMHCNKDIDAARVAHSAMSIWV